MKNFFDPRRKGGLPFPTAELYNIAFEMEMVARHWARYIEKEITVPFKPIETSSEGWVELPNSAALKRGYDTWDFPDMDKNTLLFEMFCPIKQERSLLYGNVGSRGMRKRCERCIRIGRLVIQEISEHFAV